MRSVRTSSRSSRQSAFFEALGSDGIRALEEVCDYARSTGLLVIVDAKRGDIGSTARAYAEAFLEPREGPVRPLARSLMRSPRTRSSATTRVEPFIAACRRHGAGVFFLVRTSNAGAADIQDAPLSDGRPLWQYVAELVHEWGSARRRARSVERRRGGRCHASRARSRRRGSLLPTSAVTPARCRRAGRDAGGCRTRLHERQPASALVTASRSVIYAYRDTEADWRAAAGAAAQHLATQVWAAAGWK